MRNVPDDWDNYYYSCGCHASEGGCSCPQPVEESNRPWLEDSGYEYDGYGNWEKCIAVKRYCCRRTHKDGYVKKGDLYKVITYRSISDEDGSSSHSRRRVIIGRAAA